MAAIAATLNPAWETQHKPYRPYATDDYTHGMFRYAREVARQKRYIGPNSPHQLNVITVDVDHPDALLRSLWEKGDISPNVVIENPLNGHAHVVWYLEAGVATTSMPSLKALRYLEAIQEGLRRLVSGDAGYSGTLIKNPEHPYWTTHAIHDRLFTLDQLRDLLDAHGKLPPRNWRQRRKDPPSGISRNVDLFTDLRKFGYREIRRHWGDADGLSKTIHTEAVQLNSEFPEPLGTAELNGIARSVSRWITEKSDMWRRGPEVYEAELSRRQARKGRKGGAKSAETRRGKALEWEMQALTLIEQAGNES